MSDHDEERRRLEAALHAAETARDRLVAVLSHDLRSPVAAIRGLAEILRDDPPADRAESADFLTRIIANAERAVTLAANVVEATRLAQAPARPLPERIRVADVLEGAVGRIEALARVRGVSVEESTSPETASAILDPILIERGLVNLLANGIERTPAGGRVFVDARAESGAVVIQVRDGGPEIPPTDRSRLFELGDGSEPATRLGLFVAREIVAAHGGALFVDSAAEGGSVFTVTLPAD